MKTIINKSNFFSIKSLEDAFNSQKNHGAIHILLFVGTKIVSHYSKKGAFELIPQDIFLLSLYIKSLQVYFSNFISRYLNNVKLDESKSTTNKIKIKLN